MLTSVRQAANRTVSERLQNETYERIANYCAHQTTQDPQHRLDIQLLITALKLVNRQNLQYAAHISVNVSLRVPSILV